MVNCLYLSAWITAIAVLLILVLHAVNDYLDYPIWPYTQKRFAQLYFGMLAISTMLWIVFHYVK